MSHNVPAVILAAGSSERLGQPKALVNFNGETLIKMAVRQLKDSGCETIVIVTNSDLSFDILSESKGATVVINPAPENGRTGSIHCGLMSLGTENGKMPKRVLIVPVDRCGWTVETVLQLLEQYSSCSPKPAGHPLLLCGKDVEAVMASLPDIPLRDIVGFSTIDAPGIFLNIDTPEDLERLL